MENTTTTFGAKCDIISALTAAEEAISRYTDKERNLLERLINTFADNRKTALDQHDFTTARAWHQACEIIANIIAGEYELVPNEKEDGTYSVDFPG